MNNVAVSEENKPPSTTHEVVDGKAMDDDQTKYLTFNVNDGRYGVSIAGVKEIIEYPSLTQVPMTPEFIRGVINLRGNVVPVIDLAARLGQSSKEITKRTCVIIVEPEVDEEKTDVGFVVDAVYEVVNIPDEDIEAAPAFGAEIQTDFIQGMAKRKEEFVILLEMDRVLSIDELAKLTSGN